MLKGTLEVMHDQHIKDIIWQAKDVMYYPFIVKDLTIVDVTTQI